MKLVIIGSEGNIGRRLMAAFPGAVGIDARKGAEIRADLAAVDYRERAVADALRAAEAVVHVGTVPDPQTPEDVHWQAVVNAGRLLQACAAVGVPRIVLPSSDWARPKPGMYLNPYAHSKRVLESMAAMYSVVPGRIAVALRIGWVPRSPDELVGAADWLIANYWPDERLLAEFRRALGMSG